jgi:glycosyltransferase involved in cell wall biosynthesis
MKRLSVFGYAEALRADVEVKGSTYVVAPLAVAAGAAKMLELARRGDYDLIHAHWVVPNGFMALPACRYSGLPLVLSLHGSDVFLSEKRSSAGRAARMAFRRAAGITACSDDLARRSRRLGALQDPVTIPYGVSIEEFESSPDDASRLRLELGLAAPSRVVLAVGRLVRKKGFEVLLDAVAQARRRIPDLNLVVAGRGDLRQELETRAEDLGLADRVHLVGNVSRDRLPSYYSMADVVAVPSIRDEAGNVDGLPNVLLEAMASGAPTVASAVAGIPQAVTDGKEALLVAERDPRALAKALVELLESREKRDRLGAAARARARDVFSWSRVGERFEHVFRSVTRAGGEAS